VVFPELAHVRAEGDALLGEQVDECMVIAIGAIAWWGVLP
jgi:hypothetical protein